MVNKLVKLKESQWTKWRVNVELNVLIVGHDWTPIIEKIVQLETLFVTVAEVEDTSWNTLQWTMSMVQMSVWDKAANKNRKSLDVKKGNSQGRTEFQIDFAIQVCFISQKKLHELKIRDIFSAVKSGPSPGPDFIA